MITIILVLIFIASFLFIAWQLLGNFRVGDKAMDENAISTKVKINGKTYELEIANTPAEREKGLMDRQSMDADKGMIFIFPVSGIYPFWMKNTYIPLDIIWLNENKEVVYIYENAKPCSNVVEAVCNSKIPPKLAKYVIELNAGEVKDLGLQVGTKIDFNPPSPNSE